MMQVIDSNDYRTKRPHTGIVYNGIELDNFRIICKSKTFDGKELLAEARAKYGPNCYVEMDHELPRIRFVIPNAGDVNNLAPDSLDKVIVRLIVIGGQIFDYFEAEVPQDFERPIATERDYLK